MSFVDSVRSAEVDTTRAGIEHCFHVRRNFGRRACEGEAVEHIHGNERSGVVVAARLHEQADPSEQLGIDRRRRVERAYDIDVHRHLPPREGASAIPVLVDDRAVNGFRQEAPTRTHVVAAAISRRAGRDGWNQRSLKTVTTSKPASSYSVMLSPATAVSL